MALLTPNSKCVLCNELLYQNDEEYKNDRSYKNVFCFPATGLSVDFLHAKSQFSKFDDNCIHQKCFNDWDKKKEFVIFWNKHFENCEDDLIPKLCVTDEGFLKSGKF